MFHALVQSRYGQLAALVTVLASASRRSARVARSHSLHFSTAHAVIAAHSKVVLSCMEVLPRVLMLVQRVELAFAQIRIDWETSG